MNQQDSRYEDLGPKYFANLCGGEILSCERGRLHNEHQANPMMSRWCIVYRKDGRRHVASFVAKKFARGHEREIATYRWLQANTTVNMPALVDFCCDAAHDNCWMLTENCYNFKDHEYYYLNPFFFSGDVWPPATAPIEPPEAYLRPLADLHGKTLCIDWASVQDCPIPPYRPAAPTDLYEQIAGDVAVIHGGMNYQEIGYRTIPGFPPMWCLFDWETARIGPIYFDLAQVCYGMLKEITDADLEWYADEVRRLSGRSLSLERIRMGMNVCHALHPSRRLGAPLP